jgi:hypothetical protein
MSEVEITIEPTDQPQNGTLERDAPLTEAEASAEAASAAAMLAAEAAASAESEAERLAARNHAEMIETHSRELAECRAVAEAAMANSEAMQSTLAELKAEMQSLKEVPSQSERLESGDQTQVEPEADPTPPAEPVVVKRPKLRWI